MGRTSLCFYAHTRSKANMQAGGEYGVETQLSQSELERKNQFFCLCGLLLTGQNARMSVHLVSSLFFYFSHPAFRLSVAWSTRSVLSLPILSYSTRECFESQKRATYEDIGVIGYPVIVLKRGSFQWSRIHSTSSPYITHDRAQGLATFGGYAVLMVE